MDDARSIFREHSYICNEHIREIRATYNWIEVESGNRPIRSMHWRQRPGGRTLVE